MITRIDPAIPLNSPKGPCLAHFLIDNGIESDLQWVVFQDNTGECWTWSNKDIRAQKNITHGRDYVSPFYDTNNVKFKCLTDQCESDDEYGCAECNINQNDHDEK